MANKDIGSIQGPPKVTYAGKSTNLPTYQKRANIQPAAGPAGFTQAGQQIQQGYNAYANIAAGISQQASLTHAAIAGSEAGQTPGKDFLLPPITDYDKAYRAAYLDQSTKILDASVSRDMSKLAVDFAEDPSPTLKTLDAFSSNAKDLMNDRLAFADTMAKNDLKRSFEAKYDAAFMKLSQEVVKATQVRIVENGNVASSANYDDINNFSAQGMVIAADNSYLTELKNIQELESYIGADNAMERRLAAKQIYDTARYEYPMMKHYNDEGELQAIRYLKAFEKRKPADLTNVEHVEVTKALYNKLKTTQQIRSTADEIEYSKVMVRMAQDTNGLLSIADLNGVLLRVSTDTGEKIKLKQQIALNNLEDASTAGAFMNQNRNNRIALRNLSDDDLNKGFASNLKTIENQQGSPATLNQQGMLARAYDAAIPEFNKRLESGITSKNPQVAAESSSMFSALRALNPNTVENVSTEAALRAGLINRQIITGSEPLDAVIYASEQMDKFSQQQIKERDAVFKETLNSKYKGPTAQMTFATSEMGFSGIPNIPPGLSTDFIDTIHSNFNLSGDWDDAVSEAKEQLSRVYSKTKVNGFEQVMFLSPDRNVDTDIVRKLLKEDLTLLFDAQKREALNNPDTLSLYYYEFNESTGPKGKRLQSPVGIGMGYVHTLPESDKISVTRVSTSNQKDRLDGIIIISSDKFTPFVTNEMPNPEDRDIYGKPLSVRKSEPSYAIEFLPDGNLVGNQVYDPYYRNEDQTAYAAARFQVSSSEIDKLKRIKMLELEEKSQAKLKQKEDRAAQQGIISVGEGFEF